MDSQSVPPPKTPQPGAQWLSVGLESRTPFRGMNPLRSPADRNDNRFSTQRPAHFTIKSSRTKGVKKTKVGFDADQCGFLHINDIILTVSGNLKRTKTRKTNEGPGHSLSRMTVSSKDASLSPSKHARHSVDSVSTLHSESQAVPSRLKTIPERLTSPFRKDKLSKDSVSSSVVNFMRSEEKEKKKKESIDMQLQELDSVGTSRLQNLPLLTSERGSIASGTSMDSAGSASNLWRDLGFKDTSLKPTPSLYETLLRDSSPPPEKTTDDERIKSPSAGSTKEEKPTGKFMQKFMKKKSEKKKVTIVERDGSVYSPESDTELNLRDLDEKEASSIRTRSHGGLRFSTSKTKEHVAKKKKKIATSIESEEDEEEEERTDSLSSTTNLNRNTNCRRTELCLWESYVFSCASPSISPPDGRRPESDDSGVPHGWHQSEALFEKESPVDCQDPELLLLETQLSRAKHQMQELRAENDCLRQEHHARQTSRTLSGSSSDRRESYQSHHYWRSLTWLHFLTAVLVGVFLGKMIL